MKKIKINQFQSYYDINENNGLILDFIKGTSELIDKNNQKVIVSEYYSQEISDINLKFQEKLFNSKDNNLSITLIPSYKCNMNCSYCYEGSIKSKNNHMSNLNINNIIQVIKDLIDTNKKQNIEFNLLGGEPIMKDNFKFYDEFFSKINNFLENYKVNCISNGLEIYKYIDKFINYNIKFCQITLDGYEQTQNKRRTPLNKNINGFKEIVKSIDCLLENNINVSVRVNIDEENLKDLRYLAKFAIDKKWVEKNFSIYLYPISVNGNDSNKLYLSEEILLKKVLDTLKSFPKEMRIFNLDFHGIRFLDSVLENKTPIISKYFCDASKGQYVFDAFGNIYTCWWGSCNDEFKIGKIMESDYNINYKTIDKFKNRNIKNIKECVQCKFKYICGGGCTFKAFTKNKDINSGNCSNFDDIFRYYLDYKFNN